MKIQILLTCCSLSLSSCNIGADSAVKFVEMNDSDAAIATSQLSSEEGSQTRNYLQANERSSFYRTASLYDGKLKIAIPASFTEMSADKIIIKYPNAGNRPNIVFTNEMASVNVAFTKIAMPTEQEDLPDVKIVLSKQLQAANPMNFQSRIEKINGADYVIFEFESKSVVSNIYNLMFATDVDGELVVGTFNCTES